MSSLFFAAGVVALITGVIHSVFGEILIFRQLRSRGLVPTMGAPPLRERNVRILWATWHLASVFGWAFAGVLLRLAVVPEDESVKSLVVSAAAAAYLGGSVLVLIGTQGRHPGWIALLLVAVLAWLGAGGV